MIFAIVPAKIFIYSEEFIPYKFVQLLLCKKNQEERGTKDKAKQTGNRIVCNMKTKYKKELEFLTVPGKKLFVRTSLYYVVG